MLLYLVCMCVLNNKLTYKSTYSLKVFCLIGGFVSCVTEKKKFLDVIGEFWARKNRRSGLFKLPILFVAYSVLFIKSTNIKLTYIDCSGNIKLFLIDTNNRHKVNLGGQMLTPIDKAIRAVGSQKGLAEALGQSPQFINMIKRRGGKLTTRSVSPETWVKATGLPKRELFPEFQD